MSDDVSDGAYLMLKEREREKRDVGDDQIRTQIAQLLTGRCNNCYRKLPGEIGCSVHSAGWNWPTSNFGPFCDDCMRELTDNKIVGS